ncbi:MAG: TolC family protein [Pseudomonadota bacterium]|nr:TolC family protein [Pseudomonadota bacterium]
MIVLLCGLALAMTPDEAVRAATANDPTLAGAEADLVTAQGARRSASWLRSNPEVELGADVGGQRFEASVTQDVSLSGAGFADARSGRYGVEAAEAGLVRARLVAAAEARRAWARLAAADGALRAAEREKASAKTVRSSTEARRGAGEASDLELELARLEEARGVAAWLHAVDERADAQAELAAITGDATATAEGDPLEAVPPAGSGGARSDVAAAEARVEAARAVLARERAQGVPSVGLGAFVEREGDRTLAGPAVRVELPIWQQNAGGRGAAKGDLAVAEAQATATRARAEAEQASASRRLTELGEAGSSLAPGVDASADAAARAIEAGVTSGQIDPVEAALLRARVFEGQRGWYAARLAEAEGRLDAALAVEDTGLLPR